ncbi:hypothetical protein XaC1_430 [Xanthomonas phage XaC1]|nr:hypothetical protein XaC1_430 [Xanthomonas phage XaC1]
MKSTLSYFRGALTFLVIGIGFAAYDGYMYGGMAGAWPAVLTMLMLAGLEISMSMDNAVVNAGILKHMSPFWRKMFLTVGMFIAVFGMRAFFPLVIISITGGTSLLEAGKIALFDHEKFQSIMLGAHMSIMGFGAAFLLMVGLNYFVQKEHETIWIPVEKWFEKLPEGVIARLVLGVLITTPVLAGVYITHPSEFQGFAISIAVGFATYVLLDVIKAIVGGGDIAALAAKHGVLAFLWLEVIDASFSLDGVVGAFSITNDPVLIAIGCGLVGAMTVRDATVYLVETGKLDTYEYLEPGAMWAILALVTIMFVSAFGVHVPEVVAGGVSIMIIIAAVICSIKKNGLHDTMELENE